VTKYIVKPKANGVNKRVFDTALEAIAFWERHTGVAMHKEGKTLNDPITIASKLEEMQWIDRLEIVE
tara:strand:+ start:713 stop:913 length:201 start_codon:yes stop_codon:yes gene_type:complete